MRNLLTTFLICTTLQFGLQACSTLPEKPQPSAPVSAPRPLKIALALGGGAARGFAHIGVIKALEAQGIFPDIIVGTSAGAVVGSLYAAGNNGFELNRLGLLMDEASISDWAMPMRGVLKGEALQNYINKTIGNKPIEQLAKPFYAVATDLQTGQPIVFARGNTGQAVRASSAVPSVFMPVVIGGREYVDGGLVAPVPVSVARKLGADFVIAVDISAEPQAQGISGTLEIMLQTFAIMGQSINKFELEKADVVIHPQLPSMKSADFAQRNLAILAGEQAAAANMANLKKRLQEKRLKPD